MLKLERNTLTKEKKRGLVKMLKMQIEVILEMISNYVEDLSVDQCLLKPRSITQTIGYHFVKLLNRDDPNEVLI